MVLEVQRLKDDDKNPLNLSSECMSVYACVDGISVCMCACVCVFVEACESSYYSELYVSFCTPDQTYIACNWQTDVKDKCYDLDAAQVNIIFT